jgi:GntR family transcriptional regulator
VTTLLRSVAGRTSLPERAAQDIRDAVRAGAYPEGRLPAEAVLAQQLGVSKATVRHAVSILEQEGLLSRRQGAGTFIVGRALELHNNLSVNFGVTDLIESAGYVAGTLHISVEVEAPDERTQRALGLDPAARVLSVRRTRTADGRVVAQTTDIVALALLEAGGLSEDAALRFVHDHRSLYEAMADLGVLVRDGVAEIFPWKADAALAGALETPPGALLLRLDQTDFDSSGDAIIMSTEYFLADAFKFQVYRKGSGSRGPRASRQGGRMSCGVDRSP